MLKRLISIFLALIICMSSVVPTYAYDTPEHNKEIEYVLFGNMDYKNTHPDVADKIKAIEYAVYLCVDQYTSNTTGGIKELKYLKDERKIPNMPKSIDVIDFKSNQYHRKYTHMGWNFEYTDDKSNWPVRQQILLNTVNKELFSSLETPLSWFPWLSERIFGKNNYKKQCESFCILLYCVHILGDHIAAGEETKEDKEITPEKLLRKKTTALAFLLPLSHTNDKENPGLIPDVIKNCKVIFESQAKTRTYKTFMQELQELQDISESLYMSTGGVNEEEELKEYNACAEKLLEVLATYVPGMLKNEEFFEKAFYK